MELNAREKAKTSFFLIILPLVLSKYEVKMWENSTFAH